MLPFLIICSAERKNILTDGQLSEILGNSATHNGKDYNPGDYVSDNDYVSSSWGEVSNNVPLPLTHEEFFLSFKRIQSRVKTKKVKTTRKS